MTRLESRPLRHYPTAQRARRGSTVCPFPPHALAAASVLCRATSRPEVDWEFLGIARRWGEVRSLQSTRHRTRKRSERSIWAKPRALAADQPIVPSDKHCGRLSIRPRAKWSVRHPRGWGRTDRSSTFPPIPALRSSLCGIARRLDPRRLRCAELLSVASSRRASPVKHVLGCG